MTPASILMAVCCSSSKRYDTQAIYLIPLIRQHFRSNVEFALSSSHTKHHATSQNDEERNKQCSK